MTEFDNLPSEVLAILGSYCSAADVVNLAIACPPIADAVLPGIYQCIIVDTVPRALYETRTQKLAYISAEQRFVPATTVHTIAGIKQLLETLARHPKYASKVRSFSARGSIGIRDISILPLVRNALRNLTGMSDFEWTACPELPPAILSDIPTNDSGENTVLLGLTIDLATRPGAEYPRISLPNLRRLHVRPFLNRELLTWVRKVVAQSYDLEDISLCRFLDTKSEVGSSFTFIGRSDTYQRQEIVPAVSIFFDQKIRRQLRKLSLNQIDTSSDDCATIGGAVDLTELTELQLVGSGREDEHNHGLMAHITQSSPKLLKTEINWDSSVVATTVFLQSCCTNTRSMKITIKNEPQQIVMALARICRQLQHLDIQILCEFQYSDLLALKSLSELEVLKLPFNHNVNSWKIAAGMNELKLLELRTQLPMQPDRSNGIQSTRRSANMGLLTGGILDQWDNHIRSPLQGANLVTAASANANLEYLIVDGRITQLRHSAPSMEGYSW